MMTAKGSSNGHTQQVPKIFGHDSCTASSLCAPAHTQAPHKGRHILGSILTGSALRDLQGANRG